jgi:hypothetical protein
MESAGTVGIIIASVLVLWALYMVFRDLSKPT